MEESGGQIFEGSQEVLICIVDDTYGKPSNLGEEEQYEFFKSQLEHEFSQKFEEVDVAPGYSLPAFATFVQTLSEFWPFLVATFFLAKPVSENLEVWQQVAEKIKEYFSKPEVVLGRNAAAALALEAVFNELDGIPKSIECTQYYWRDRRFDEKDLSDSNPIQESPRTEYLGMAIHHFVILADGIRFKVVVDGKSVQTKRLQ